MAHALNLLIVDEKKQIADPLMHYLYDRFGNRVDVSSCFDAETCIQKISNRSHVLILDYPIVGENKSPNKGTTRVLDMFYRIKKRSPQNQVSIITSALDVPKATEEIERKTNQYVLRRERYVRKAAQFFDQTVMVPFRKKFHEFNVQDFIVMFIISFCIMAFIYFAFMEIFVG
jgi:DNA-binding NtrC family response regulator